jgi:hypothetical protein
MALAFSKAPSGAREAGLGGGASRQGEVRPSRKGDHRASPSLAGLDGGCFVPALVLQAPAVVPPALGPDRRRQRERDRVGEMGETSPPSTMAHLRA